MKKVLLILSTLVLSMGLFADSQEYGHDFSDVPVTCLAIPTTKVYNCSPSHTKVLVTTPMCAHAGSIEVQSQIFDYSHNEPLQYKSLFSTNDFSSHILTYTGSYSIVPAIYPPVPGKDYEVYSFSFNNGVVQIELEECIVEVTKSFLEFQ